MLYNGGLGLLFGEPDVANALGKVHVIMAFLQFLLQLGVLYCATNPPKENKFWRFYTSLITEYNDMTIDPIGWVSEQA